MEPVCLSSWGFFLLCFANKIRRERIQIDLQKLFCLFFFKIRVLCFNCFLDFDHDEDWLWLDVRNSCYKFVWKNTSKRSFSANDISEYCFSYPPPREMCAGPSCTNPYKYRDSKTKVPLCSLQCYNAVQAKTTGESWCCHLSIVLHCWLLLLICHHQYVYLW